jgi:cell division protease FtsH
MYAQSTLAALDAEVKTIVEDCYQQALTLLTQHKDKLDTLATALLEKEELSAQEVYALAK